MEIKETVKTYRCGKKKDVLIHVSGKRNFKICRNRIDNFHTQIILNKPVYGTHPDNERLNKMIIEDAGFLLHKNWYFL